MIWLRIKSNINRLSDEEVAELNCLLMKAGFTEVSIGGGELDFVLELDGPEIEAKREGWFY
jgi:hypothetical protein